MDKCDDEWWRRWLYFDNNECNGQVSDIQNIAQNGCDDDGDKFEIIECRVQTEQNINYQSMMIWIKDIFIVFLIIVILIQSILTVL